MKFDRAFLHGKVMTVKGLIDADGMGVTLPHEHMMVGNPKISSVNPHVSDMELGAAELAEFYKAGGRTIADMTSVGIGREPEGLIKISEKTGVNIIMGCGYFMDAYMPDDVASKTIDNLKDEIIRDIIEGVGNTGIHTGVIGEVGISNEITPNEIKSLKASARAQKETGVAVNLHINIEVKEAQRFFALGILKGEGIDMGRVIISHFVPRTSDIEYYERIARMGCNIEFELFGFEITRDISRILSSVDEQVTVIKILDKLGILKNVFISQDVCRTEQLTVNGGYGYAHILKNVVPEFLKRGITDRQIRTIMVDNPRRVFPFCWDNAGI